MSNITIPNWLYLAFMMIILIVAGLAEYMKLAPANTFYTVFLLVIGLISPSPAFPHTMVQTPEANITTRKVDVQSPPATT